MGVLAAVGWRGGRGPALVAGAVAVLASCGPGAPPTIDAQLVTVLQGVGEVITVSATGQDPLRFSVSTPPAHGTLSGSGPAFTYTAAADFEGMDGFVVTVSDGAASASANMALKVLPVRGPAVESQARIDALFLPVLRKITRGGLVVAVSRDGHLVLARGYGYAAPGVPMGPNPRTRIASISKVVTMAAVMHLVEAGKLHLEDALFTLLPELGPPVDPRAAAITLRSLLDHSSGLPPDFEGSSLFWVTSTLGRDVPCAEKARQAFQVPLVAAPGEQFEYSNMGFCVLSLVVERASGQDYQGYARDQVLAPLGIRGMRFEARDPADRPPDEVTYFDFSPCGATTRDQCRVLSTTGGAASWTATPVDLTRLVDGVYGGFLDAGTLREVVTPSARDPTYGLGTELLARDAGTWVGHTGQVDYGTVTYALKRGDGWTLAMVVNSVPTVSLYALGGGFEPATQVLDAGVDLGALFPSVDLGPYLGP